MGDYGLLKNHEGYADPTPAALLTKPEPGDIWQPSQDYPCLVIKNHGNVSTVLVLTDCERPGCELVNTTAGPRYSNPCLVTYRWHNKMGTYIENIGVEGFKRVAQAVEDALEIQVLPAMEVQIRAGEINIAPPESEALKLELDTARAQLSAANAAAAIARNQLDLLRGMYNDLLAKVLGGRFKPCRG